MAGTGELRYFHGFSPRYQLEGAYRLHVQGAADAYRASFDAAQPEQTSDPDLGDFVGHLAELRFRIFDPETIGAAGDWNFGVSYYTRDNGLDMVWLSLGTTFGLW